MRIVALAWLLSQAASLAAFVPEHCCVSHTAEAAARAAAKSEACHEAELPAQEPGDACPMHATDGAACPMKQPKSHNCCGMSNPCDGPGQHLATLFAYVGTIERPIGSAALLDSAPVFPAPSVPPLHRVNSPDAPPPKA